mmetsp:Transcript_56476/g.175208  ORF Transcript_56476/g.175208 Transcript_56476/m.175208 type:complete len:234 (-) Transcript_56476:483-1184(-)
MVVPHGASNLRKVVGDVHVLKAVGVRHLVRKDSLNAAAERVKPPKVCPGTVPVLPIAVSLGVVVCAVGVYVRVGAVPFDEAVAAVELHGARLELAPVHQLCALEEVVVHHALLDEAVGPLQVPAEASHVGMAVLRGDALVPSPLLLLRHGDLPAIEGRLAEHGVGLAVRTQGHRGPLCPTEQLEAAVQHAARTARLGPHEERMDAGGEEGEEEEDGGSAHSMMRLTESSTMIR